MEFKIEEVDGEEEKDLLRELHIATFEEGTAHPNYAEGDWWIAYQGRIPAAFIGLIPSTWYDNYGYFIRVGVLPVFRGHGLQRRLMRVMERRAKRHGWNGIISDTTSSVESANNFIKSGYMMFDPQPGWAWPYSLYWWKEFK